MSTRAASQNPAHIMRPRERCRRVGSHYPGVDGQLVASAKSWLANSRPGRDDLAALNCLIELVYEDAVACVPWQRFLETLAGVLNARAACLVLRAPSFSESGLIYVFGGDPVSVAKYINHYFAVDPFVNLPADEVTTLHRFIAAEALESSEFFREHLQPNDMVHTLGVDVHYSSIYDARVRVCRGQRSGDFAPRELAFMRLLVPHLKQAIRLHMRLNMADGVRDLYAGAMDQLTMATIVLDEQGKVIHCNALAQSLLRAGDGLALQAGAVMLAQREDETRLQQLIADSIAARGCDQPNIVRAMRVRRPSGKPDFGLVVRSLPFDRRLEKRSVPASVALFVNVESARGAASSDLVQHLFGLTRAEAELAKQLADGLTLKQAARVFGVAPNTVRCHLRSIFAKTGVARQADLLRLLLSSVAVLG